MDPATARYMGHGESSLIHGSDRHGYVALGCVFDYATIACALRWGVALVGDYHY